MYQMISSKIFKACQKAFLQILCYFVEMLALNADFYLGNVFNSELKSFLKW